MNLKGFEMSIYLNNTLGRHTISWGSVGTDKSEQSSGPGEFHPQALTEPDVSLSTHPALIDQPKMAAL